MATDSSKRAPKKRGSSQPKAADERSRWERQALNLLIEIVGIDPEEEHKFHPSRRWRFDFAYPQFMVAIEVEGGTWSGGRHIRPQGFENDCVKYNAAAKLGWTVYRVPPSMCTKEYFSELFGDLKELPPPSRTTMPSMETAKILGLIP